MIDIDDNLIKPAYQLALPPSLSEILNVFHVSQFRKFLINLFQPILLDTIEVTTNLTF